MTTLPIIAQSIAVMGTGDELEALVAQMSQRELCAFLAGAEVIRKLSVQAVKMAESRVVAEKILAVGETVEFNGHEYVWGSERRGEVADPLGFKTALYEILPEMESVLAKRALLAAFVNQDPKVYLSEIAKLKKWGPPAAAAIANDFVQYKDSPPHLKRVAEDGE